MKICKVKNCNINHYAKGFCNSHYRRYKEGKPLIPIISKPKKSKPHQHCCVENCENKYYAKGYCANHYATPLESKKINKCKAYQYCGSNAVNHEYCCKHQERISKNMSMDLTVKYTPSGDRNRHWKGGVSQYKDHYSFKKNRLIKLKASNYKCVHCNNKATVVHHLDKSKDNHSLDNLIAVCQKCHINIYHKDTTGRKKKIK